MDHPIFQVFLEDGADYILSLDSCISFRPEDGKAIFPLEIRYRQFEPTD